MIVMPNRHPRVRDEDFKRFLRFPPRREFPSPLEENAAWARSWFAANAKPWYCIHAVSSGVTVEGGLTIDGEEIEHGLPESDGGSPAFAAIIAASAGGETEREARRRWDTGEPDRYFFLECYASAAVEALLAEARRDLWTRRAGSAPGEWTGGSPGFRGWPVRDNGRLVRILTRNGSLPDQLSALDSGMLVPKKSRIELVVFHEVHSPRLSVAARP